MIHSSTQALLQMRVMNKKRDMNERESDMHKHKGKTLKIESSTRWKNLCKIRYSLIEILQKIC